MNNQQTNKQQKTVAKIGLLSSITIVISAVIGIGIFFKNKSVLNFNDGNAWGVLISWVIAAIITITTALAFAEIISGNKKPDGSGLAGWARIFCGHKIGRFILISMPMFYFLFKLVDTSFFASESIFLIFNTPDVNGVEIKQDTYLLVIVAYVIMLIFLAINSFSTKTSKAISLVASFVKFLPLIVVGILGITIGAIKGINNETASNSGSSGSIDFSSDINVLGIFSSLPGILFAFDSFLTIGNAAGNMTNPKKDIPKSILIGMPIVVFLYLFVTVGQLLTGSRDVYAFFNIVVNFFGGGEDAKKAINIVIGCLIMISLFGSVNAFTLTAIRSMQSAIDAEILIGSTVLKRITNGRNLLSGALMALIMGTVTAGILAIPTIVLDNDSSYDGVSNLPTLFFFLIYAIVILFGLINHYTNKVEVHKVKGFTFIAIVAILGCSFAFGYNLFYEFFIRYFTESLAKEVHWGMFKGSNITRPIACGIVWGIFALFLLLPFVNDLLIHWIRKGHQQRLIWM